MLTSTIDDEFDSLYESIDKRMIDLCGESSPIVCVLNKPLVHDMEQLLDIFVGELNEYISNQKICISQSSSEKFKIDALLRIDEAENSVLFYSRHRDNYRRILSKYNEMLDKIEPIDRVIAANYSKGNPLRF